ncbi:MAG: tRNA lysidine(34) synthetase TilS [Pseudomonadota bacterium]|jgi:tRNA(Ile)-lysidine synthase
MALLHLAQAAGWRLQVATVDHGLRAEAAAEAAAVAAACGALGLTHNTLRWHWDGRGNLQDAARRGRLRLLADWARGQGLAAVALGHTRDDLAETFVMRLARDAGVDGLSAMAARREAEGMVWLRPLLGLSRAELRGWLAARGIAWAEDPSNADARFARVRARHAVAALATAGVDAQVLADLAHRMAEVRDALEAQAAEAAAQAVTITAGDVVIDRARFDPLPAELRRRLLLAALIWVTSAEYGPRGADLLRLRDAAAAGRAATLAGCRMMVRGAELRLLREARAVAAVAVPLGAVWDGRWQVSAPDSKGLPPDLTLRALGEDGLRACPGWRDAGHPRQSLIASPAVWRGAELVAAPLAGFGPGWRAQCRTPVGVLASAALSH